MQLNQSLRSWLIAQPSIVALIGDEVYADALDEAAVLPAVAVRTLSTRHTNHLGGRAGLATSLVTIDVKASKRAEAYQVALAISNSGITRIHGAMFGTNVRSVVHVDGPSSGEPEFPIDGSGEIRGYLSSLDFEFSYVEPFDP